jgi:hypothetical protein
VNTREFSVRLRGIVIDESTLTYRELLSSAHEEASHDRFWALARALYAKLSEQEREVLLGLMRQAATDAVATALSVIDGPTVLDEAKSSFELRCVDDGTVLSGTLCDYFLGG